MAKTNKRRRHHTRRRAKRNGGLMLNRRRSSHHRRRHHVRRNPRRRVRHIMKRRRHYSRNPRTMRIAGISLPPLDAVLYTGAGFIVPPMVQSFAMRFIPAQYQTNQGVVWAVKAASAILPPVLVKRFVSARAGNLMLLGGVASLVIDAVRTFAPGVIPGLGSQPFLGKYYFPNAGMGAYIQPRPAMRGSLRGMGSSAPLAQIFDGVPERLSPATRF